jgi:nitrogen fixation protein NifU and related proteins
MNYNPIIIENFKNPKNQGELKNADGVGKTGNPVCGDVMQVFIKVSKNKIKDIKFQTLGCGVAIAASSVLTQLAKGKTLAAAAKISKADIIKKLGGKDKVPAEKIHCSLLAEDALKAAIKNYQNKK